MNGQPYRSSAKAAYDNPYLCYVSSKVTTSSIRGNYYDRKGGSQVK